MKNPAIWDLWAAHGLTRSRWREQFCCWDSGLLRLQPGNLLARALSLSLSLLSLSSAPSPLSQSSTEFWGPHAEAHMGHSRRTLHFLILQHLLSRPSSWISPLLSCATFLWGQETIIEWNLKSKWHDSCSDKHAAIRKEPVFRGSHRFTGKETVKPPWHVWSPPGRWLPCHDWVTALSLAQLADVPGPATLSWCPCGEPVACDRTQDGFPCPGLLPQCDVATSLSLGKTRARAGPALTPLILVMCALCPALLLPVGPVHPEGDWPLLVPRERISWRASPPPVFLVSLSPLLPFGNHVLCSWVCML